eukprot:scaffold35384_cov36-Phaeocystis_antarctica.AAC.2
MQAPAASTPTGSLWPSAATPLCCRPSVRSCSGSDGTASTPARPSPSPPRATPPPPRAPRSAPRSPQPSAG